VGLPIAFAGAQRQGRRKDRRAQYFRVPRTFLSRGAFGLEFCRITHGAGKTAQPGTPTDLSLAFSGRTPAPRKASAIPARSKSPEGVGWTWEGLNGRRGEGWRGGGAVTPGGACDSGRKMENYTLSPRIEDHTMSRGRGRNTWEWAGGDWRRGMRVTFPCRHRPPAYAASSRAAPRQGPCRRNDPDTA
jgi:hypothetical protein